MLASLVADWLDETTRFSAATVSNAWLMDLAVGLHLRPIRGWMFPADEVLHCMHTNILFFLAKFLAALTTESCGKSKVPDFCLVVRSFYMSTESSGYI